MYKDAIYNRSCSDNEIKEELTSVCNKKGTMNRNTMCYQFMCTRLLIISGTLEHGTALLGPNTWHSKPTHSPILEVCYLQ